MVFEDAVFWALNEWLASGCSHTESSFKRSMRPLLSPWNQFVIAWETSVIAAEFRNVSQFLFKIFWSDSKNTLI